MSLSDNPPMQRGGLLGPGLASYPAHRIITATILAAATAFYMMIIARGAVVIDGRVYFTLFDDAMISMRYAKSLAAGGGLAWNPSDVPIEGFTNLLWTLWMAVLHVVPVPEGWTPLLVSLSSAACLIAASLGAQQLARTLGAGQLTSCVVLAVVAFYYPLVFWSLRGMETGVLAALMVWAIVLALREQDASVRTRVVALCAIVAALILVREDSVVFVAVLGGYLCVTRLLAGSPKRRLSRSGVAVLAAALVTLVALTTFRWLYFGDVTPNTYTLKVTGVALDERLRRGVSVLFSGSMLQQFAVIALAFALSIPGLRTLPRARLTAILLPVTAFLAQAAYSAFVGGDVWEDLGYPNRFIVIAMPGLLAVTLACLQQAVTVAPGVLGAPRVVTATLLTAASLIIAATSAGPALAALRHEPDYVSHDRAATETGLCLRHNTPAGTRIAVVWAGSLPYYADRFAIDLLGKMDRKIAASAPKRTFLPGHNKWDYAYSIETYHPDLILQVWGGRSGDIDIIRAHGYEPVDPAWPCFAPGFLVPGQVFARRA